MACEEQVDFYIDRPVLDVFGYLSSLQAIAGIKVDYVDPQHYQIHLSNKISFSSWGEDIVLSFYYDPTYGGTRILAFSKPEVPTTLIDYGKNRKNVEAIRQYILSLYQSRQ